MNVLKASMAAAAVAITMSAAPAAHAGYSIVQGASAPTYANTVVFNSPVGNNLPTNTWAAQGISSVVGYDTGFASVTNMNPANPWAPNTNVLYSPWGLEITFDQQVTSVSFRGWGNGGTPGPFGGGTFVTLKQNNTDLFGAGFNAAWGGVGNEWFNVTTTAGSTFNRIVFSSNLFAGLPQQFISQMSWTTAVPAPGAMALLGLAGVVGSRRRRR